MGYGFYLWQTLTLVLLRHVGLANGWLLFGVALPLVFLGSALTFNLVELPFHDLGRGLERRIGRSREP